MMATLPVAPEDAQASSPAFAHDGLSAVPASAGILFRAGSTGDTAGILTLIDENLAAGHLLPRSAGDVSSHTARFVVAESGGRVAGCAELAPLSRGVAEVRSLVVDAAWRGQGLGSSLINRLCQRARTAGFATLCAFTHEPGHFVRLGFSITPHVWFPEKIALDCVGCAKFRTCGQVGVALQLDGRVLDRPRESHSRLPVLPGTRIDPGPSAPAPRHRALTGSTR
jgi:N-acetylglutamate synthase-like GNAT family acetyltransferase